MTYLVTFEPNNLSSFLMFCVYKQAAIVKIAAIQAYVMTRLPITAGTKTTIILPVILQDYIKGIL